MSRSSRGDGRLGPFSHHLRRRHRPDNPRSSWRSHRRRRGYRGAHGHRRAAGCCWCLCCCCCCCSGTWRWCRCRRWCRLCRRRVELGVDVRDPRLAHVLVVSLGGVVAGHPVLVLSRLFLAFPGELLGKIETKKKETPSYVARVSQSGVCPWSHQKLRLPQSKVPYNEPGTTVVQSASILG